MEIECGDYLELSWLNHIESSCVASVQKYETSSTLLMINGYILEQIYENYTGYKQQPENFTLKDCEGKILSIAAKVRIIK